MKVTFDATFEDFVDVCKRSQETSWSSYLVLVFVVVACSASIAVLVHWIFENWGITILAAVGGCAAGAYSLIESRDKLVRDHLKKNLDQNTSVPTEVEVTEMGISTKCLGHTLVQEWSTIDQIEETDDAIYFRNKFGQYCSARKRGFASDEEIREFLKLARSWQGQT
jgi:hypothetical protein